MFPVSFALGAPSSYLCTYSLHPITITTGGTKQGGGLAEPKFTNGQRVRVNISGTGIAPDEAIQGKEVLFLSMRTGWLESN